MIELRLEKQLEMANGSKNLRLHLQLEQGKTLALYGPSGCGKTSLLRMIAGLMRPDKGFIRCNGQDWYNSSKGIVLRPQQRTVGMVFQDYALFPNMSVEQNLRFAAASDQYLNKLLHATDLWQLRHKKPPHLSGGQQQRLALARALIQAPKILLLDEAFSALDTTLKTEMQHVLLEMQQIMGLTIVMVSHDLPEIVQLAQSLLVFEKETVQFYAQAIDFFETQHHPISLNGRIETIGQDFLVLANEGDKHRIQLSAAQLNELEIGQAYSVRLMGYYALPKKRTDDTHSTT